MILKLLLLVAVVTAVYLIFFKPKNRVVKKPSGKSEPKNESDEMVACVKCDTYISVDEAFIRNGEYYCSSECMNT